MIIWIDADACPKACKEIIFKCAAKRKIRTILVANDYQRLFGHPFVELIVVKKDPDAADFYIAEHATSADLVVTQDIPLAAILIKKQITTIGIRGETFSETTIGERLATRNLLFELRESRILEQNASGPSSFSDKDKHRFAASFDKHVTALAAAPS